MSTAAAAAAASEAAPAKNPKKKLILIMAAVVLVAAAAGGGTLVLLKMKAAQAAAEAEAEAEDEDGGHAAAAAVAKAHSRSPIYVPLDPFVVNLADRQAERYAQVGVTLEINDAKFGDQLKVYMPAIRNNILMVLAHKTSTELLDHEGKLKLAGEIRRETLRPMGIEVEDASPKSDDDAAADGARRKRKSGPKAPPAPVTAVHFSSFIIQ